MADFGASGFDANKVEPNEGFDPIPAGDYDVAMVASEKKATKDGTGDLLECQFQILNGKFQNRKVYHRFNLWLGCRLPAGTALGENQHKAKQISAGELSALCRAIGVMTPMDSAELHSKPMRVGIKVKPAKGEFAAKNEISSFKPRQSGPGGHPPAAPPVYQQATAAFPPSAPVAPPAAPAHNPVATPW